ncbi:hypothetical protein [Brasilonema sp. UFV-L1]|uniref:hypothetical protein n=1 Tax=Brasilonema sp. UFV-L1 TaxID=2234130 RepID=UPI00145E20B8|nr:hypothetical protein [Brasilonema sp. UFV-L1]NMG11943.1 hypothetical protein [Brasilonema sp. UFV-L1]
MNNFDDDDEFGGATNSVAKIFRNRKSSNPPVDDDDEFSGGTNSVEKIFRNRKSTHTSVNKVKIGGEIFDDGELIENKTPPLSETEIKISEVETQSSPKKREIVELDHSPIQCEHKIFSPSIPNNQWYIKRDNLSEYVKDIKNSITIPLVIDTEFTDQRRKKYKQQKRFGLTTQIKGVGVDTPKKIYAHTPLVNTGREMMGLKPFPMVNSDFHPIDYLGDCGLEVDLRQGYDDELRIIPKCFVVVYGHFLTAELNMICGGSVKERIKQLQRSNGDEQITSGRRAFCQTTIDGMKLDWVSLKHIIIINGIEYELCLKLVDTGAIHGVASYKDFCDSVGWKLSAKDNFTKDEKGRMLDMAIERPIEFEEYSLGDLDVYEALNCYFEQWQVVYEKLGLSDYYQCPKLTIGGTVKDLFEASLAEKLGLQATDEDDNSIWRKSLTEIIDKYVKPASASHLRQFSTMTRALLAKVEGGRCRNNRPTDVFKRRKIKGEYDAMLICDIDISGCYGEGQRNQSYFLGVPYIFDYEATATNNEYVSLRKWLTDLGVNIDKLIESVNNNDREAWTNQDNWGELISGAWYARISTRETLKYAQDYFASWFTTTKDNLDILAKTIRKMKVDTELQDVDWVDFDEETGTLKIFNNEIWNAVLTHDGLQWILAVASPRQRNELLDKVQVLAGAIYPRSQRIDEPDVAKALEILNERHVNWQGKNTTEVVRDELGNLGIDRKMRQCHAWFDINLGDLIVNNLLIERKKAQIQYGKKSSLDVLFKLCINTLYGDMVSKYFVTSNPVVGNNITARARALAWYMEKGLHGWQTVTDGCAFELNEVMFPLQDNINGEIVNQHRDDSKLKRRKIKRSPLANVEYLMKDGEIFINENGELKSIGSGSDNSYINLKAMEHLQTQIKLVNVLHSETDAIKVDGELKVMFVKRKGQFSFETKNVYFAGAFHGSANYLLANDSGIYIKARGYETKKPHESVEGKISEEDLIELFDCERYGKENNPAKDFMNQLLNNPEAIKRQVPAIKSGILKIKDYKNLAEKYDRIGIEPGDSILRTVLMQEFSLAQFTFKTYEQYMMWFTMVSKLKDHDKQSLEGYFLNEDGTLNFVAMVEKVDEMIANDVTKPFDELDPHRHRQRSEKRSENSSDTKGASKKRKKVSLSHPSLVTFEVLKETLNESELVEDILEV